MDEGLAPRPESSSTDSPIVDPDDLGTDLVAHIESRLQTNFPELERRPELIETIETVVRERSFTFSGPNPPPHMLAEYERVCPGWAARLLEQGDREQLARIEREKEELAQTRLIIESEAADKKSGRTIEIRGQIFGFIAFLVIALLGGMAVYLGQITVAITCFTTFVIGVVGMFITGRRKQPPSNEE